MRMGEHRPVAFPSPENIRDSPLPPNQRVINPQGAQTGSLCSAYAGLRPQATRRSFPHQKSRKCVLENLNMTGHE
jgi:hypothetical protein